MPIRQEFIVPISNDEEWKAALLNAGLVIIDVHAGWAGPCTSMKTVFKKAFFEFSSERLLKFYSANTDGISALVNYRNKARPVFLVFKDGELQDSLVGVRAVQLGRIFEESKSKEDYASETLEDPGDDEKFTRPLSPLADEDGRQSRRRQRQEQQEALRAQQSQADLEPGQFEGEPSELLIRVPAENGGDDDEIVADVQNVLAKKYGFLQDLHEEWSPSDIDSDAATSITYEAFVDMARAYDLLEEDEREPQEFVSVFKESLPSSGDAEDADAEGGDGSGDGDKKDGGAAAAAGSDTGGDGDGEGGEGEDGEGKEAEEEDDEPIQVDGCIVFEDFLTLVTRLALFRASRKSASSDKSATASHVTALIKHIQHVKDPEAYPEDDEEEEGDAAGAADDVDSLGPTPGPGDTPVPDEEQAEKAEKSDDDAGSAKAASPEPKAASPEPKAASPEPKADDDDAKKDDAPAAAAAEPEKAASDTEEPKKEQGEEKDSASDGDNKGDDADAKPSSPSPETKDDSADAKKEEEEEKEEADAKSDDATPAADVDKKDTDATADDTADKPASDKGDDDKAEVSEEAADAKPASTDKDGDDAKEDAPAEEEKKDEDTAAKGDDDDTTTTTTTTTTTAADAKEGDEESAPAVQPRPPSAPKPEGGARRPAPRTTAETDEA